LAGTAPGPDSAWARLGRGEKIDDTVSSRAGTVVTMPCPVDPMLATSGPLPAGEERWSFEPKWDGFRAIVHTDGPAPPGRLSPRDKGQLGQHSSGAPVDPRIRGWREGAIALAEV
jgi:hypothetical protein